MTLPRRAWGIQWLVGHHQSSPLLPASFVLFVRRRAFIEARSPDSHVQHQFATNVFGLLTVTRAFLPRMRERRSGRIINVSSVVGRLAFPGFGVYSASKFAVEALSDALRMELAGFSVSVVLIEPNFVATNLGAASHDEAARFPATASGYEQLTAITGAYLDRELANGIPAETVARRIAAVATARRPKARYVVPPSSKVLVGLL